MKLSCSQKELSTALSVVSKAVDASTTLPVLNNVLLEAQGKKLFLTGTNLEIALSCWIEAKVVNEGAITLPAKMLSNYVNYLKEEKVEMFAEGGMMMINTPDSKTKIKGLEASEFPPVPPVEKEGWVQLPSSHLRAAIRQVVFSAAMNTTRPVLGGVYFNLEKDRLKLAATDSYRLSEKTLKVAEKSGELSCIIPARTLLELGSVLDTLKSDLPVDLSISKNQAMFSAGQVQMTSRLVDGQFPNYQQIIPKNEKAKVECDVSEFTLALKRINIFARENNNKVFFKTGKDHLIITTDATQYGEGQVTLPVKTQGESAEIALNSQFILELLSNAGADKVILELGEKTVPALFRLSGNQDYFHIIMPLKL